MNYRFVPGQLVEVVHAHPCWAKYIGERFVLSEHADLGEPAWRTPWVETINGLAVEICAEECNIKPVDDNGDFMRFMERTLRPVDLGKEILDPIAN